ncbi:hypothetical protein Agabi119p4_9901 [Agaricus bisporus var. burnettii]|uniref:Uncharacterized protein n=1 Tax=Agaricus bisporus var. burnettii TaxID=192524 RepID=A0A8H7C3A6_AGABI|nr:hypothetical protein Agabi119p4_9901 [Agaricus bisporus var. burnettii]
MFPMGVLIHSPNIEPIVGVVWSQYGEKHSFFDTVFVAPWSSELIFDICVFAMTLWKTLTLPRGKGLGLLTMIMRDGTLYFAAMATLTVGNVLTFLLGGPLSRGSATILVNAVSSMLVSRLLLNLRDPKWQTNGRYYDSSTINRIGFQRQDGVSSTFAV